MTISQGGCPRGTCPADLSRVKRPNPVISKWFPPIWVIKAAPECVVPPVVVPQSMLQTPGSSVVVAHGGRCSESRVSQRE